MNRTVAALLIVSGFLLAASGVSQSWHPEYLRRPITRTQVEALFARGNWPARGSSLSAGPPAPREAALAVWPAKDSELLGLLPKHGQVVVAEALLRRTPGVVPVLRRAIELPTYGNKSLIKGLGDIPGEESTRALISLLDSKVARNPALAAVELITHKRLPDTLKPKVRRIFEAELTADYRTATQLAPSYLAISHPAHARKHLQVVLKRATDESNRHLRLSATIWLASVGDSEQLKAVRSMAAKFGEANYAIGAIQVLGERYGASERTALEAALTGPTYARRFAAEYLGVIGDRRSIPALRAAAKTDPLDVANAGWIKTIRGRMLDIANTIESGHKFTPEFPKLGGPAPWWRR